MFSLALSSVDRELIKDRISKLAFFPLVRLDVKKLKGFEKTYRLRVGDYRVIFEFEKDEYTCLFQVNNLMLSL
ncbi:MAG: type II toxin-antitoxin system RelE/ParE family toxin [Archaeoglobales archaeon]|nr:type II toxin-antitoxin system RelE/ParE family toxin [Archaeoglobales archaeon]